MKNLIFCAALSAFTVSLAPAVHAQDTGLIPFRAKIGGLLPSQSQAKDNAGKVALAGEVDVAIPRIFGGSFASIGYQDGSKNGGKLRVIPITVSRTFQPLNPAAALTGKLYFGAGAGVYLLKGDNGANSDNKTTVGGFGQVGYQLPRSKFFIEGKYQLVAGKAAGLSPNGVLLFVGTSF